MMGGVPAPIVPSLSEGLSSLVRLGLVRAEPVDVGPSGPGLLDEMDALSGRLASEHAGKAPAGIPGLEPARRLYRAFGIDPTRTRPSSEALLRRVLAGKPLPLILNAVDLCNLCALKFLLPIGLYDAGRIQGAVTLRRGAPGESYQGVRKDDVHLEGRIVLADEEGPFGNPTADSMRTAVTQGTSSLWMVIFAPAAFPLAQLEADVAWSREAMVRHLAPAAGRVAASGGTLPNT
ncbi:MAG TPA: phenylalanine--tRNA ligase beta subunit-related protein [Candidatus Polarisedimenticolia bacterium]|jgi:DNA/RNA-binding domain of Phe-tRNA-synthetase-like protein